MLMKRIKEGRYFAINFVMPVVVLLFLTSEAMAARYFDKDKMDKYLKSLVDHNQAMLSISFYEKGEFTYTKQFGFADENTRANAQTKYKIGSITKTFTSTIIFQLIESGKLNLSTPLSRFYPEIKNANKITIDHLLSHKSGVFNYTNDAGFSGYVNKYQTKASMVERISLFDPAFEPGEKSDYSNSNYLLLGYIIETITDKSYAENLQDNITKRIGLINTKLGEDIDPKDNQARSFYFSRNKWQPASEWDMSVASAAGGIISTPADLNLFMKALFNGKLVSENSLKMMVSQGKPFGKGLFMFPFYQRKAYGHNGRIEGFNSTSSYYENDDLAVAVTVNGLSHTFNDIMIAVLSIYFDRAYQLPDFDRKVIQLPKDKLGKYTGTYFSGGLNMQVSVSVRSGALFAQVTGQPEFPIDILSEYEFQYKPEGIVVKFGKTWYGNVDDSTFTLYQGGNINQFVRRDSENIRKPVIIDIVELKKYEGVFSSDTLGLDITYFVKGDALYSQASRQSAIKMQAFSDTDFEFKPAGILNRFSRTKAGEVDYSKFTLYQSGFTHHFKKVEK